MIKYIKKIIFSLYFFLTFFGILLFLNINTSTIAKYKLEKNPNDLPKITDVNILSATMGGTYGQFEYETFIDSNDRYDGIDENVDVQPYKVYQWSKDSGDIFGTTDMVGKVTTSGKHTMMVRKDDTAADHHFNFGTTYHKMAVGINGISVIYPSSDWLPVNPKTEDKDIKNLEDMNATEIDTHTATISVYVAPYIPKDSLPEEKNAFPITDYTLEVIDSAGAIMGTPTATLDSYGNEEIKLTGLLENHTYTGCKIVARDTTETKSPIITSGTFDFTTKAVQPIDTLSDPSVSDITINSAKITTTSSITSSLLFDKNEDGESLPYYLEVQDSAGARLGGGISEELNTTGQKVISLSGLEGNKEYTDSKVVARKDSADGDIIATSKNFTFTTLAKDFTLTDFSVGDIGKHGAKASVNVVEKPPSINGEFKDYVLVVRDDQNHDLGKTTTLSDGGTQSIDLSNLNINTSYTATAYALNPGDETEIYATSNSFTFTTNKGDVGKLSTPTPKTIGGASATIEVDASESADFLNELNNDGDYNDYVLEVRDENGSLLGDGRTSVLTSGGTQQILLSGLQELTSYNNNYVVALNPNDATDIYATSDKFNFTTIDYEEISALTNEAVSGVTYDSVTFSVDVASSNSYDASEEIKEYALEVTDGTNVIGSTSTLNTNGLQTFTLVNLPPSKTYDGYYIQVVGNPEIKSGILDSFTTLDYPFSVVQNSFEIEQNTKTSHTFKFNVDVQAETEDLSLFTPESLILFDGDKELNIININESPTINSNVQTFEFEVRNLKAFKRYNNFYVSLDDGSSIEKDKVQMYDSNGNIPSIKTKMSLIQIIGVAIVSTIGPLFLILLIVFIIMKFKRGDESEFEFKVSKKRSSSFEGGGTSLYGEGSFKEKPLREKRQKKQKSAGDAYSGGSTSLFSGGATASKGINTYNEKPIRERKQKKQKSVGDAYSGGSTSLFSGGSSSKGINTYNEKPIREKRQKKQKPAGDAYSGNGGSTLFGSSSTTSTKLSIHRDKTPKLKKEKNVSGSGNNIFGGGLGSFGDKVSKSKKPSNNDSIFGGTNDKPTKQKREKKSSKKSGNDSNPSWF